MFENAPISLNNNCRLCGQFVDASDPSENSVDVLSTPGLKQRISTSCQVNVSEEDELSTRICNVCYSRLEGIAAIENFKLCVENWFSKRIFERSQIMERDLIPILKVATKNPPPSSRVAEVIVHSLEIHKAMKKNLQWASLLCKEKTSIHYNKTVVCLPGKRALALQPKNLSSLIYTTKATKEFVKASIMDTKSVPKIAKSTVQIKEELQDEQQEQQDEQQEQQDEQQEQQDEHQEQHNEHQEQHDEHQEQQDEHQEQQLQNDVAAAGSFMHSYKSIKPLKPFKRRKIMNAACINTKFGKLKSRAEPSKPTKPEHEQFAIEPNDANLYDQARVDVKNISNLILRQLGVQEQTLDEALTSVQGQPPV